MTPEKLIKTLKVYALLCQLVRRIEIALPCIPNPNDRNKAVVRLAQVDQKMAQTRDLLAAHGLIPI